MGGESYSSASSTGSFSVRDQFSSQQEFDNFETRLVRETNTFYGGFSGKTLDDIGGQINDALINNLFLEEPTDATHVKAHIDLIRNESSYFNFTSITTVIAAALLTAALATSTIPLSAIIATKTIAGISVTKLAAGAVLIIALMILRSNVTTVSKTKLYAAFAYRNFAQITAFKLFIRKTTNQVERKQNPTYQLASQTFHSKYTTLERIINLEDHHNRGSNILLCQRGRRDVDKE